MIYKFQYNTQEERQNILYQNLNLRLIEVADITEGHFLTFTDEPVYLTSIEKLQEDFDIMYAQFLDTLGVSVNV